MLKFMRKKCAEDKFEDLGFKKDESPPADHVVYRREIKSSSKMISKVTEVIEFIKEKDDWKCGTWRDYKLKYDGVKYIRNKAKEYSISENFRMFEAPDESTFEVMCMQLHELRGKDKKK